MQEKGVAHIKSPIEEIKINRDNVKHLVEENEKARVGFLNYAVRTMENPNLIVSNGKKNSYIKLFFVNDLIKPHLQIVKVTSDGSFYVTNYRPTKNQVYNEIIKGQVVYDLSSLRNDSVLSFVNSTISQSKADVKYEQAVYEDADEPFENIRISDPYTHKFYEDKTTKPQITSLYNIKEVSPSKKNSTKAGFENNGETSYNSTISQSDTDVKYEQAVYEDADERHKNVLGQDVYHSALMVGDNPYSVQFKVDIPLETGTHNYAGHKITDIKIASFEDVGGQITIPYKHLKDAISNISLAVLRGKVNPARYDAENNRLYQNKGKAENRYLFVAPATVVDKEGVTKDYFAEVVVREGLSKDNSGKKRFYIHEVELKNKLTDVFSERYNTLTSASSKSIISKLITEVNSDGKFYQKAMYL